MAIRALRLECINGVALISLYCFERNLTGFGYVEHKKAAFEQHEFMRRIEHATSLTDIG